jgi:hypothetical protein
MAPAAPSMPSRGGSGGQCQPRLEISSWQARSQPPAGLRADPAMLVHLRVPAALAGAGPASGRAGLERGAGEAGVLTGVPRQHPAGSAAEAGAVQAGADAPDQAGLPRPRPGTRRRTRYRSGSTRSIRRYTGPVLRGRRRRGRGRCAAPPLHGSPLPPIIDAGASGRYPLRCPLRDKNLRPVGRGSR